MKGFFKFTIYAFNVLYPVKIIGRENIPEGGAILVCNHYRAIDPGFVARAYIDDAFYLAKKELFSNKLMIKILKSYGAIPIDRDNPDIKTMFSILKILKEGHKLVIFPEGTRNKSGTDELQPLKPGSAMFAVKAKCPIVPMMLLKKSKFLRKTYLIVGEPFELSEYYGKQLTDDDVKKLDLIVSEKMKEQHAKLRSMFNEKGKFIKRNETDKG